jgi:hypothetical protein
MLTIKECKEILNNEAEVLTEDDIIEIREWLSTMADVLIESIENSE